MLKDKSYYIGLISQYKEDDVIYLVDEFCKDAGLFIRNNKFLYLVKDGSEIQNAIKTEYLNLFSKVDISPVSNNHTFPSGEYSLLEFNGNINDEMFNSFLELCYLHSQNVRNVNIFDFFNSLISLFQIPHEQQYKNFLGFYGEIELIVQSLLRNKNLISNWHVGETDNCKYDFVFKNCNAEIKTIVSQELIVTLKHNQLFNKDKNYLILVQLEKNNSGKTLKELLQQLKEINTVKNDYEFWLKIEKERLKIDKRSFEEEKLSLVDIYVYNANMIKPFEKIPTNVTKLNYDLDVIDFDSIALENFLKNI